jgi:hypothetical protein
MQFNMQNMHNMQSKSILPYIACNMQNMQDICTICKICKRRFQYAEYALPRFADGGEPAVGDSNRGREIPVAMGGPRLGPVARGTDRARLGPGGFRG